MEKARLAIITIYFPADPAQLANEYMSAINKGIYIPFRGIWEL